MNTHYPAGGIDHWNRDGQPVDLWTWAKLCEDDSYRQVAQTQLDGARVSTVWMGFDLGLSWMNPELPPLPYETMVFGGPYDLEQYRWPTDAAALEGHAWVVEKVMDALGVLRQTAEVLDQTEVE